MASHPPNSCCYKGIRHEGKPTGEISALGDIEVYIKHPENESTQYGLLLITDIIGHRFVNAQLIADQFAANGYFVLMPDLFYGDPVSLNHAGDFDFAKWMKGELNERKISHLPQVIDPIVDLCLTKMRTEYKCKKVAAVGYCFGGKYVVRHLREKEIDVGYVAHPSNVTVDEVKRVQLPLAISAAEDDYLLPAEKRHETEIILQKLKIPYQMNLYSGVKHGFAVRCDLSDPVARYAKENAFLQALQFFETYLKDK